MNYERICTGDIMEVTKVTTGETGRPIVKADLHEKDAILIKVVTDSQWHVPLDDIQTIADFFKIRSLRFNSWNIPLKPPILCNGPFEGIQPGDRYVQGPTVQQYSEITENISIRKLKKLKR